MNALEVSHLCKQYRGFRLNDVSFTLPRGYIMGLIGANGAGKTSIIKSILNLVIPSSGKIEILGSDSREDETKARSRIGVVLDEPRFHEDVRLKDLKSAHALFYDNWGENQFQDLCQTFDLPLRKKFKQLSQGMKTKFALALALSQNAELLILDEPTSGLDPVFRRQLLYFLQEFISDGSRSVLFSTHITSDLEQVADYVTFIKNGELIFSTTRHHIEENWVLARGGEALLRSKEALFEGVQRSSMGVEALTREPARAKAQLPEDTLFERATLEDIMLVYGRTTEDD